MLIYIESQKQENDMSDYFLDYVRTNNRFNYNTKGQERAGNTENEPVTLAYPSDDAVGESPSTEHQDGIMNTEEISVKQEIAALLTMFLDALLSLFKGDNNKPADSSSGSNDSYDDRPSTEPDYSSGTPATLAYPSDDAPGSSPSNTPATKAYPSDDAVGG